MKTLTACFERSFGFFRPCYGRPRSLSLSRNRMRLPLRSLHHNLHRKCNRSHLKKKNPRATPRKRLKRKKPNQRSGGPKRIWRACAAMAFPWLGKINRRALAERKRARQTAKRKRASYPCPARMKNTGAERPVVCSTGQPQQNNELRRKRTKSRHSGAADLTTPTE